MKRFTLFIFNTFILANTHLILGQNLNSFKFDFGNNRVEKDYIQVAPLDIYSNEKGFGFDYDTSPVTIERQGSDALKSDFVTSDKPFYFSVKLPEGNYTVSITMGDKMGESMNCVRAESRRLMLENVKTSNGNFETRAFTVNLRTPKINDTLSIRLKSRELGYLNWDNKLTFEFTGIRPCICNMEITRTDKAVTVFLAGNSTVVDQDKEPWASWGQMIPRFFNKEVSIANYAESGEALNTFISSRRLEKILNLIKPNDYLFIEFGHNDQKQKGEGVGPWTSYKKNMVTFIQKTRNKGGIPVLVTPVHRRNFDSTGHVVNTLGDYPDAVRQTALEEQVPLIDLNAMSKILYEALGSEMSKKAFVHYPAGTFPGQEIELADNTHFNTYGAYEIAQCILTGIKKSRLDLAQHILCEFKGFEPEKPDSANDWYWPLSPMVSNVKPDGN